MKSFLVSSSAALNDRNSPISTHHFPFSLSLPSLKRMSPTSSVCHSSENSFLKDLVFPHPCAPSKISIVSNWHPGEYVLMIEPTSHLKIIALLYGVSWAP